MDNTPSSQFWETMLKIIKKYNNRITVVEYKAIGDC